jgi:flagellar motor switch protein FliN/FliY
MLSQAEIDALLKGSAGGPEDDLNQSMVSGEVEAPSEAAPDYTGEGETEYLTSEEKDALGEIGNITMGSSSTTLSELIMQKVVITSPRVHIVSQEKMFDSFDVPYVFIQVEYVEGLQGFNVLVLKLRDASIIADLMMGGDGTNPSAEEIGELEISAASEAMNQMIGTASTSLSNMFSRSINISPPITNVLKSQDAMKYRLPAGDPVIIISFNMQIGNLLDTEIMQVLSIETAKEEAALLWEYLMGMSSSEESQPEPATDDHQSYTGVEQAAEVPAAAGGSSDHSGSGDGMARASQEPQAYGGQSPGAQAAPQTAAYSFPTLSQVEQRKMELLLDVPLRVSVILGRTKRPIKEVLNLTPGAIVELQSLVDEPVEILVNGTLVARGEVVVVNENFGVRITSIISPEERIKQLRS